MNTLQNALRNGLFPQLSTKSLEALKDGLLHHEDNFVRGNTTSPIPLPCNEHWECEGACLIGYAAWKGEGLTTIGEIEKRFATIAHNMDELMGEPASVRYITNPNDEWEWGDFKAQVLPEIELELARRQVVVGEVA